MNYKYHAKEIIEQLLARPMIQEDGFYNGRRDEELMVDIVHKYLSIHFSGTKCEHDISELE